MPGKKTSTILMEVRSVRDDLDPGPARPLQPSNRHSATRPTNLANSLQTNPVRTVLDRLFAAAAQDEHAPQRWKPGVTWESATARERADASEFTYMPISRQGGDLLYILARAKRPNMIIEFGTSYGISTLYLAAAVADNGTGRVVSTELNEAKVVAARANLAEAQAGRARHDSARRRYDDLERCSRANRFRTARRMERLVPASSALVGTPAGDGCVNRGRRH
jgi:Methyltransferase domain